MKIRELRHNLWNIGFYEDGLESLLTVKQPNIHWAKKKIKDRWFADPYILDVNDSEIIVLAEEYCYNVRRGRLARVVFDRHSYEEKYFSIILDLPTHLSFPFIYRKEDKVYLIPENSASGSSTIYEYNDTTQQLKVLHHVSEEAFTDATLFKSDGVSWLWTTMTPDPNGKTLSIYRFDEMNLRVVEKVATVDFPFNTARNAGECFTINGKLYRPAQDCTKCYGNGVVIQEVKYDGDKWRFKDVNSFYPDSFKYNQGIHTLNNYNGLVVFDTRGYRYPIVGRLLTILFKIIGRK